MYLRLTARVPQGTAPRILALALLALTLVAAEAHAFEWQGRLGRLRRTVIEGSVAERVEALRALSRYPASSVDDVVIDSLRAESREVRLAGARAAGRLRLSAAVGLLAGWIDSDSASLRAEAIQALGRIGDDESIGVITRALGDVDEEVRRAAVVALRDIGLEHGAGEVLEPITGRLDDDDGTVRSTAVDALASLGDDRAVVALIGRTRDDEQLVRVGAYRALGRLGASRGVPALLNGIRDEDESVRLAAIVALGRIAIPRAADPLAAIVRTGTPREARAALNALSRIPGERSQTAMIQALARPELRNLAVPLLRTAPGDELTRMLAMELGRGTAAPYRDALAAVIADRLGQSPTTGVCERLVEEYELHPDSDPLLRALAACGDPDVLIVLLEQLARPSRHLAALDAVETFFRGHEPDPRAVEPLIAALEIEDSQVRVRILRLLGELGQARALDALRGFLGSSDPAVRLAAIQSLGKLGDPAGSDALLELLQEDDVSVRHAAARALSDAAGLEATRALFELLGSRHPTDRHAVLEALGGALARLPPDDLEGHERAAIREALVALVRTADASLSDAAIETLGRWSAPEAAESLRALLTPATPEGRARRIVWALREHGPLSLLRDALGDRRTGAPAALALGERHLSQLVAGTRDDALAADVERLVATLHGGAWPTTAAASFALARLARAGGLSAEHTATLCPELAQRSVFVRANVVMALATLGARCPGVDPVELTHRRHHAAVRAAAIRWLQTLDPDAARGACANDTFFDAGLRRTCQSPALRPLPDEPRHSLEVWAFDHGQEVLRERLAALRLPDGTVMLGETDARGRLRLDNVPAGSVQLDEAQPPLQPRLELASSPEPEATTSSP